MAEFPLAASVVQAAQRPRPSSPSMKPHSNPLDPYFYFGRYQTALIDISPLDMPDLFFVIMTH